MKRKHSRRGKRTIHSTALIASRTSVLAMSALIVAAAYFRLTWLFLFLALFLGLLAWNYGWTVLTSRFFKASVSAAEESLFAGESFTLSCHFTNRWVFPLARCGLRFYLPASFTCSSDAPLEQIRQERLEIPAVEPDRALAADWNQINLHQAWLRSHQTGTIHLNIQTPHRGCYWLPSIQSFVSDPAGLYQRFRRVGNARPLLVMPQLKGSLDLHKVLSFEESRSEDPFGLDDPYQPIGVRDYQASDSLKSINWYATARTKSLKTHLYQRKVATSCLVVLDLSCGFSPSSEPNVTRETDPHLEDAISTACGIALSQLDRGSSTAFCTNAPTVRWTHDAQSPAGSHQARLDRDRQVNALGFAAGEDQERAILRLCARIDDTARATPAGQQRLWAQLEQMPSTTLVYIVCYHSPPDSWKPIMQVECSSPPPNPADFYTRERLAQLPSTRIRLLNLSR